MAGKVRGRGGVVGEREGDVGGRTREEGGNGRRWVVIGAEAARGGWFGWRRAVRAH